MGTEKIDDSATTQVVNDIFLHRYQNKRFEQLDAINKARMSYVDSRYKTDFLLLDHFIDDIEEDIFSCMGVDDMAKKYGVRGIVFAQWCRGSENIERIRIAYELSAEYRMGLVEKTIKEGLDDRNLLMQQTGLYRELALHHSRMAGFQNQKKFGKKPDTDINSRIVQIVTDDQFDKMIASFRKEIGVQKMLGTTLENSYIEYSEKKDEHPEALETNEEQLDNIIKEAKALRNNEEFDLDNIV